MGFGKRGRGEGAGGRTGEVDELLGGRVEVLGEVVEAKDAGDADTVIHQGRLVWSRDTLPRSEGREDTPTYKPPSRNIPLRNRLYLVSIFSVQTIGQGNTRVAMLRTVSVAAVAVYMA